jgi:hypothetical protein
MVAGLLMIGSAGVGFAGDPWFASSVGAFLMVAFCLPENIRTIKQYAGEPSTDIVFAIVLQWVLNITGALTSAWAGYGLRLLLLFFRR